jgi:hypothetical protein
MNSQQIPPLAAAAPSPPPPSLAHAAFEGGSKEGIVRWSYRGIQMEVPENMTMDLWKKLSEYVNVLKPEND